MAVPRIIDASNTAPPGRIGVYRKRVRRIENSNWHAAVKRERRAAVITKAAKEWDVSRQWVKELMYNPVLGVKEPPLRPVNGFTPANALEPYDEVIERLWTHGLSATTIAARIKAKGGPIVTRQAIQYRARKKLGLAGRNTKPGGTADASA